MTAKEKLRKAQRGERATVDANNRTRKSGGRRHAK